MRYVKQVDFERMWITDGGHGKPTLTKLKNKLENEFEKAGIGAKITWISDKWYIIITFDTPEDEAHFILLYNQKP
jgi:hypothetical protein